MLLILSYLYQLLYLLILLFGAINNFCKLGLNVIHKLNIDIIKGILITDFNLSLNIFLHILAFFPQFDYVDFAYIYLLIKGIVVNSSSSSSDSIKA